MPHQRDLWDYETEMRELLLAAHADGWKLEVVAEGAVTGAQNVLHNREHAAKLAAEHA